MPDLIRGLTGSCLCVVTIWFLPVYSVVWWVVGVLCLAFVVFGALTVLRATMRIKVSSVEVVAEPSARSVSLAALDAFNLEYFSTRRDGEDGWMQLTLGDSAGGRLSVDSRLDRFESLVEAAASAAHRNGLEMGASTIENLHALRRGRLTSGARESSS